MRQPKRIRVVLPTTAELNKKLSDAKAALKDKDGLFADPGKAVGELDDLQMETEEVWPYIRVALDELTPDHYTGGRPPQPAYEKVIEGLSLFAFSWMCKKFGKMMYLKFALKKETYYYVSLHPDRPRAVVP